MGDSEYSSQEEEQVEVFQDDSLNWGKSTRNYYESEDESASGSDAEMLLEETIKIQKKQASLLDEKDFYVQKSFVSKHSEERSSFSSADISGLLEELKHSLSLIYKKVSDSALPSSINVDTVESTIKNWSSFYDAKNSLLYNYATNIVFYLLLKSKGIPVDGHPVIEHLVKVKLLLEKIKPIESYVVSVAERSVSNGSSILQDSFKANLAEFIEQENSADLDRKKKSRKEKKEKRRTVEDEDQGQFNTETYTAPRIAPVHYNEGKRTKETFGIKPFAKDLQEEFNDRPEEIFDDYLLEQISGKSRKQSYEEDNFTRISETKERKQQRKFTNELVELNSFGESKKKNKRQNSH